MRFGDPIATVFLRPARSFSIKPTPNRKLYFQGGSARVFTDPEVEWALNRADVSIRPEPRYQEHVAQLIQQRDELHPVHPEAQIDNGDFICLAIEYPERRLNAPPAVVEPEPELESGFTPYGAAWEEPKRGRPRRE